MTNATMYATTSAAPASTVSHRSIVTARRRRRASTRSKRVGGTARGSTGMLVVSDRGCNRACLSALALGQSVVSARFGLESVPKMRLQPTASLIAPPMIASRAPAAPTTQRAQGVARMVAPIARWRLASPSRQRKTSRSSTVRPRAVGELLIDATCPVQQIEERALGAIIRHDHGRRGPRQSGDDGAFERAGDGWCRGGDGRLLRVVRRDGQCACVKASGCCRQASSLTCARAGAARNGGSW